MNKVEQTAMLELQKHEECTASFQESGDLLLGVSDIGGANEIHPGYTRTTEVVRNGKGSPANYLPIAAGHQLRTQS